MTDPITIPAAAPADAAALSEAALVAANASVRLSSVMVAGLPPELTVRLAGMLGAGWSIGTLIQHDGRTLPTISLVAIASDAQVLRLASIAVDGQVTWSQLN